ncbi:zinc chelation protein SecC [Halomonas sp. DQ26W]|uniref:YchJ family protein n=1 Tax=Halomonas sp. DQ26W TaxID=2282311 RepID=UPI000DF83372|nr:YchJ family protein [Halomonas sp. DQ26W]RDB43048.1 zinc chelation protein SecC [Halomonas sp. DQ26W]
MQGKRCPCGSGSVLAECCGRYHRGAPAPSPEDLMRSRYSAFALDLTEYLLASWHTSTRPQQLEPGSTTRWVRLEVVAASEQGEGDSARGRVHFRATFHEGRRWAVLEENSRFVQEAGRWVYLDGSPSVTRLKPGRNDPCPCGSGRKFKSCCGQGSR